MFISSKLLFFMSAYIIQLGRNLSRYLNLKLILSFFFRSFKKTINYIYKISDQTLCLKYILNGGFNIADIKVRKIVGRI